MVMRRAWGTSRRVGMRASSSIRRDARMLSVAWYLLGLGVGVGVGLGAALPLPLPLPLPLTLPLPLPLPLPLDTCWR